MKKTNVMRKLLLALVAVAVCAFEPGARAQQPSETNTPLVHLSGPQRKIEAPAFRPRQVSAFSMKRSAPPAKSAVASSFSAKKADKSDLDELLDAVDVTANVGPLLDLSLRYPMGVFDQDGWRGLMRIDSEKLVNATMSIALGGGWAVRSGLNMDGWYDPGINAKISDALMKFQPHEALRYAGYAPVVGLEKRVWKLRFGFLYGVRPQKSGVSIYSTDPARQQIRLSASMIF